ncbi:hypothetical protein [Persephonella sp.]
MDIKQILKEHINTLYSKLSPSFIAVYYHEKPLHTKTVLSDKKKSLEEILGLIIYKGHQINEIIPGFEEEYIYTEGEGIQIYVYFVTPDISIVTLNENKVKFSLLKLEHEIIGKELKKYADKIVTLGKEEEEKKVEEKKPVQPPPPEIKREEIKSEKEDVKTESVEEEKIEQIPVKEEKEEKEEEEKIIKPEETADKKKEENIPDDIEELEKVLSGDSAEEKKELREDKEKSEYDDIQEYEAPSLEELLMEGKVDENMQETTPSLEEILTEDKEEIVEEEVNYLDASVLDKIYKNLAKEMGPVAKIIFNHKIKNLGINKERLTIEQVNLLISELADEILVESRKDRFLKNCNNLI